MLIGIPKEKKPSEYRIGMIPSGVRALVEDGHEVIVESTAGLGAGYADHDYIEAGAEMVDDAIETADLIVKVKEPQEEEIPKMAGKVVFGFFHFSGNKDLFEKCEEAEIEAFPYESLEVNGKLPLLIPMSIIAGRLAVQQGARCLESPSGGKGILLRGIPGVIPAKVVIIGGGTVGSNAARVAGDAGARVTVLDTDLEKLAILDDLTPHNVITRYSTPDSINESLKGADLVILSVLIKGHKAPLLVDRSHLSILDDKSVIVDVSIDEGGCAATSVPTTHENPTYEVDGIIHYCVTNIPGLVGSTSTNALCNSTLPFVRQLAEACSQNTTHYFHDKYYVNL